MDDRDFAEAAVQEGKKSLAEGEGKPLVGVVIVKDGKELGRSHRGRTGSGQHAEYGLIKELVAEGVDLVGATVYTTLEPCSSRNHPKTPCAEHLAAAGVAEVVIGMYDPNPRIYRDGWRILAGHDIRLRDFPADLREEIASDNQAFADLFLRRAQDADTGVLFDWAQHPAGFSVVTSGGEFVVEFGPAGHDSIYLYASRGQRVGSPRHATEFSQVDDPAAQDSWEGHYRPLSEGDIGMLSGTPGHLLIKVVRVHSLEHGADQNCVEFDYEFRP
ncbi:MAG: hypothetical protein QM747_21745 [Nocardioides sp.]